MANGKTHRLVGTGIGAAAAGVCAWKQEPGTIAAEMIGGALAGWLGGRLPDVLEPPTNPQHRAFAHSWVTLLGVSAGTPAAVCELQEPCRKKAREAAAKANAATEVGARWGHRIEQILWSLAAGAIPGLSVGYVSHLVLDAGTPASLPRLGL